MLKTFVKLPIKAYALVVSPLLGPRCRFQPTCSCYAQEAIDTHGVLRGLALTFRRICSCHPLSKHQGYDPVPERTKIAD